MASARPPVSQTLLTFGIGVGNRTRWGAGCGHLRPRTDSQSARQTTQDPRLSGALETKRKPYRWYTDPENWCFYLLVFTPAYWILYWHLPAIIAVLFWPRDAAVWLRELEHEAWPIGWGIYLLLVILIVVVEREDEIQQNAYGRARGWS